MAGHSHSANIAIRKGKQDRLRAKLFSKLSKDIMIAARGGPDPNFNFALRHAIEQAKGQSMPNEKIEHATKKGAGLIEGVQVQEALYEGYGPGGVAFVVECVTDNANRTRPEVGRIFEKHGGNLGAKGAVMWMFQRKGLLAVPCGSVSEDKLMEIVLEAGAEDLVQSDDVFEITTSIEAFEPVKKALAEAGLETSMAELKYLSENELEVDPGTARKIFNLMEKLDDHEDVQAVHSNLKFTDGVLALLK